MKLYIILLLLLPISILSQTRVDFMLTLSDGIKLDCSKFIPVGNPPAGGWQCVIICHGYGLTKYTEMSAAEEAADSGFYSLVYSMRGQGISEGQSNFISMTEANDLKQVVQYVKNDANTNDNKIAVTGGSQGGIIPFMAASTGMQVKTIMPDMASPEQGSNWIENGCIKMTFLWTCSYPANIVRYNPTVSRFRTWALSSQKDKWDSLTYYLPQNRDFLNLISSCQIPVLVQCTWQDKFFNTLGMIKSAYILPYNNIKMYFGAMDGHGSDYVNSEENYKDQVFMSWLNYHLRDVQNNVMNVNNKFTYACSRFPVEDRNFWTWQRFNTPTWPPDGVQNIKLYFHPNNALNVFGYGGSQTTVNFINDIIDTNVTMEYLVNTEFRGSLFDAKFHKNEIYFDTPALLADATMAGTPYAGLYYSSTANSVCQYNFQVWEVRPNGEEKLVTRLNWTDRNYTTNQVKEKYVNGQAYGHIFRSGSRIRVKLNNLDNVPMYTNGDTTDYFLRTNPFVLPVLKRGTNKVYINGSSRSYIELPLKNFVIGIKPISQEIPKQYMLFQNYPNPFNPQTKIRFSIPPSEGERGRIIRIIIYDILGKEIETLVNEQLKPGTYEADFDGSKYASGIYYYRLITEGYTQTKKMVLVK